VNDLCGRVLELSGDGPEGPADSSLTRMTHRTIERVTHDAAEFHLHTAIAALMEFQKGIGEALDEGSETVAAVRRATKTLLKLLHPMAPHVTDEWWERFGEKRLLVDEPWPAFDTALATPLDVTLVVQVNGKVRGRLSVARGASEDQAMARVREDEK